MKYFIFLSILFIMCCENMDKIPFIPVDLIPPPLISLNVLDIDTISIVSNESIYLKKESYFSREGISIKNTDKGINSVIINFDKVMKPGFRYRSEFRIEDENGNSLSFIADYYGYNPHLPEIIINEFIVKGSKSNPNKIELYVINSGNMAGIALFNGTSNSNDYSFIFPSIDVKTGEYIVIRTLSDKYPKTCIEIDDLNINNDKKFIRGIRDIRIDNFKLSSTNGVISLYSDPFGTLLDCVVYSKNKNDESKSNRNFGLSKTMNRIDEIEKIEGWIGTFEIIFPEDSIFTGGSTTTRSLNRLDLMDTDKKDDWYTVSSRNATFGYTNSKEYY